MLGSIASSRVNARGAKRVLEGEMLTGYNALCLADALLMEGTVIIWEVDKESAALVRSLLFRSSVGRRSRSAWGRPSIRYRILRELLLLPYGYPILSFASRMGNESARFQKTEHSRVVYRRHE